jgi:transposase
MSSKELRRAGVLARVEKEALNLVNAAGILDLSYRQTKRLWRRYREEGSEGLRHRSVGRESNRKRPKKFRLKVLRLVRRKYSGEVGGTIRADPHGQRRQVPLLDAAWSAIGRRMGTAPGLLHPLQV